MSEPASQDASEAVIKGLDGIRALFDRAVGLAPPERAAFLDAACGGDPALRAEVEGLLACDEDTPPGGSPLDRPLLQRPTNGCDGDGGAKGNGYGAVIGPAFGPPAAPGEVGTLGPFRILSPLGRGGMGAVYAAVDTRLGRRLALKVMRPQFAADGAARERFLREAHAAAQVSHDNVVTIYEADERAGVPYIAMQLLEGHSLDDYLREKGSPPLPEVLRIAAEAADGLAAAHQLGLVHRDVKPANLWLRAPDGRVKVLDFGLAKPLDARVGVTVSMAVVGTPAYMSPEQARGEKVDARTDLFSLGAVLYRMCGGRLPFDGPSTMAVLMALGMQDPPPLRELNPAVPEPLAALIHQLLAKKPDARPQTAAEVAARVRAMAEGAEGEIAPDRPARPTGSAARLKMAGGSRRRLPAALGASVAALLAVVACGVMLIHRNRGRPETKTAAPAAGAAVTHPGKGGALVAQVAGEKPSVVAADPDRDAAAWALSLGGAVRVNGEDRDLRAEADLPTDRFTLTRIDLHGNKAVTDVGLAHLRGLAGLTDLDLRATALTDAELPLLAECRTLGTLWLNDNPALTGAALADLERLQALEVLYLGGTGVEDAGTEFLGKLKGLRRLYLQATKVTDAGVAQLRGLADLELLDLFGTTVTGVGLAQLKDCRGLTVIELGNTRVTDAELAYLQGFPALTKLGLIATQITDGGLERLKGCRGLDGLYLSNTRMTDAGLAHLESLNGLTHIEVRRTAVSAEGLKRFHAAVPRCQIDYDGGTIPPNEAAGGAP